MKLSEINIPKNTTKKRSTSLFNNSAEITGNEAINLQDAIQEAIDNGSLTGLGGSGTFNALTGPVTSGANGGATTITDNAITTTKIANGAVTDTKLGNNINTTHLADGSVDNTEFQALNGVTSNIQTQINTKATDSLVVHLAGAETITGVKTFNAQPVGIQSVSIVNTPAGNIASTTVQAAVNELDVEKQANLQFQEEGVNLGTSGTVTTVNFTGSTVTASRVGNTVTVDVTGSGGGATNLAESTRTATTVLVTSDTGTDATLSPATSLLAGVMPSADKVKVDFITITQAVDLDALEADVADLTTLSGVPSNSTDLGTFTGTTIADNTTIKSALQSLETKIEAGDTVVNGLTGNGSVATPHKLGGALTENTTITGANTFSLIENNLSRFNAVADSGVAATSHVGNVDLVTNTLGSSFSSYVNGTPTTIAELRVNPSGANTQFRKTLGVNTASVTLPASTTAELAVTDTTTKRNFKVDQTAGHFMENVLVGTNTEVLYINPTTGALTRGAAPSGGSITRVSVTPLSGGGKCTFSYFGSTAPTFTRNTASIWTINVPAGTELMSADIFSAAADNPGSNVTLNINTASTVYNQDITTALVPVFTGIALVSGTGNYAFTTGTPNLSPTISVTPSNGDISFLINNYNAASSLGTGDSILKLTF